MDFTWVMMLRRSHPDRGRWREVCRKVCNAGRAAACRHMQLSSERQSTESLGRLQEDRGGFAAAETRCHRGVKPPSKRQTERAGSRCHRAARACRQASRQQKRRERGAKEQAKEELNRKGAAEEDTKACPEPEGL